MKKILAVIIINLVIVSCYAQVQEPDIWLFHIGESSQEVKKILKDNHYIFKDINGIIITENPTVNYLGVDWDKCAVFYIYDKVNALYFTRSSPSISLSEPLSLSKIKRLQDNLSDKFGEMREIRNPSNRESRTYLWYINDFPIRLVIENQGIDAFILFGGKVD